VLLTILWILTVAAVVAMSAALIGRHAVLEGAARVELERGRWIALACERRMVAAIDRALETAPTLDQATVVWRTLARVVAGSPLVDHCDASLEAAGTRLDLNDASEEMIVRLLDAAGFTDDASQMADALEDWIDTDDEPRPVGAEASWYESTARLKPRNGPLASIAELHRVRGFERTSALDNFAAVVPGRVSLATAPIPVLMAVPGITRETAEQIVTMQAAGTPTNDLISLVGMISHASADSLAARYADAVSATTPDPDAWLVRVRVGRGSPAVAVVLEWRVIRTGRRCVVTSTRSQI
jgi:type II secretory pathway component PulK